MSWFTKKKPPRAFVWPSPPPQRAWVTFDPSFLMNLRDFLNAIPTYADGEFLSQPAMQSSIVDKLVKFVIDNANSTGGDLKHNEDGTVTVKYLTTGELIGLRDYLKSHVSESDEFETFFNTLNDVVVKTMSKGCVDSKSQYMKDLEFLASHDDAVALSATAFNERLQHKMQCIKQNGYGARCSYDAMKDSNYCEKHAKTWFLQDEDE